MSSVTESLLAMLLPSGITRHPDRVTYTSNNSSYIFPDPLLGETFDTYKEDWLEDNVVTYSQIYGVGIINRGQANEQVTRLIFPDMTFVSLINF